MSGQRPTFWELNPEDVLGMSCEDAFAAIDKDGSGTLSYDELKSVLIKKGSGDTLTEAELDMIFYQFDKNYDGELSIQEFTRMWKAGGNSSAPPPPKPKPAAPKPTEPTPTATIEEQVAAVAAAAASSEFPLKAVLSNVEPGAWSSIDETVETHLGLRLRARAGKLQQIKRSKESVAPCAQLFDPPLDSGLSGWYNGLILLLMSPEVPPDVESNIHTMATKLLEIKSALTKKRCVHHVLIVPCDMNKREAFFSGDDKSRCWRTVAFGGVAMSEHRHLRRILEPLMTAAGDDAFFVGEEGGPVVELD